MKSFMETATNMDIQLETAIDLGRMLGTTISCEDCLELCDREMLIQRLQRIAAVRTEIMERTQKQYEKIMASRITEVAQ
jgi:hypothetical protein